MTQQMQTIDISPEKVAVIATAGVQLLNLGSTLVPGNMRAQIGVLEVYLSGLARGQLVLAPAPKPVVESDGKKTPDTPDTGSDDGPGQEADNSRSAPGGDGAAKGI